MCSLAVMSVAESSPTFIPVNCLSSVSMVSFHVREAHQSANASLMPPPKNCAGFGVPLNPGILAAITGGISAKLSAVGGN